MKKTLLLVQALIYIKLIVDDILKKRKQKVERVSADVDDKEVFQIARLKRWLALACHNPISLNYPTDLIHIFYFTVTLQTMPNARSITVSSPDTNSFYLIAPLSYNYQTTYTQHIPHGELWQYVRLYETCCQIKHNLEGMV